MVMAFTSEVLEALAGLAAPGLDNLLAIMAYGAEEHPPLQAVEAVAPILCQSMTRASPGRSSPHAAGVGDTPKPYLSM
jgi:hypothetical protein